MEGGRGGPRRRRVLYRLPRIDILPEESHFRKIHDFTFKRFLGETLGKMNLKK